MLTSFQCDVVAYMGDGFVVCPKCAEERARAILNVPDGDEVERVDADGLFLHLYGILPWEETGLSPIIRYSAEESWGQDGLECDDCYTEIVEPDPDYCREHDSYRRDSRSRYCDAAAEGGEFAEVLRRARECSLADLEPPKNRPVPRWVPCSSCGARDGEAHRMGCGTLVAS